MGKTKKEQSLKINNFFKTLQPSQVKTAAKNSKVPKTTTKASYVKDLQDRIAKVSSPTLQPFKESDHIEHENNKLTNEGCEGCREKAIEIDMLKTVQGDQAAQIRDLQTEIVNLKTSKQKLTARYMKSCDMNVKSEIKLDSLTQVNRISLDEKVDGEMFTAREKRELSLLSLNKRQDATFLRRCLEILYKEDIHVLRSKCVKRGLQTSDGQPKRPITPEKMDAIFSQYKERLVQQMDRLGAEEFAARMNDNLIKQSLSKAIHNINKRSASLQDTQENDSNATTAISTESVNYEDDYADASQFEMYEVCSNH